MKQVKQLRFWMVSVSCFILQKYENVIRKSFLKEDDGFMRKIHTHNASAFHLGPGIDVEEG